VRLGAGTNVDGKPTSPTGVLRRTDVWLPDAQGTVE
jgi:hypothetical protein